MIEKYLSRQHKYGKFDCIQLPKEFYEQEFGVASVLPEYPKSRKWMKELPKEHILRWADKYATQISLPEAENYALLIFSSSDCISHFGIFIAPSKMLHVEEGSVSKIETISSYWLEQLYAVYKVV